MKYQDFGYQNRRFLLFENIKMENGKNLHSGRTAEKKRSNAIKRDLLILIHDFLNQEGLFEAAEAMASQLDPLVNQYKGCVSVHF